MSQQPRQLPVRVIEPRRGFYLGDLRELWQFRSLFQRFWTRDLTLRYRQTALGATWVIAQPLLAAGIFSVVFGQVAHLSSGGVPYFAFSFAGLLLWNAFNNGLTKASGSMVANTAIVGKVYFPRVLLPLSAVASSVIDFLVSLVAMFVLLGIYRIWPGVPILLTPFWLLIALIMALGFGLLTASLTVRYRDVTYMLPILITFLLYASPVAYALSSVPKSLLPFYYANPLTGLLEGIRWSLVGTEAPSTALVAYSVGCAAVALIVGLLFFHQQERKFADII